MSTSIKAIFGSAVLALVLVALPGPTRGIDTGSPTTPAAILKALEEAGTPGPEHKRLEPLVGQWTYTGKLWMDPSKPPMETSGTIVRQWILGNRFLEERVVGTGPDGKSAFEGRGVIGYDKAQGKYTTGWISTMGTGISTSLGICDASGKHFTFETEAFCPIRGHKVRGRDELRLVADDKHVLEMYQFDNGKEVKVMELTAVRRK